MQRVRRLFGVAATAVALLTGAAQRVTAQTDTFLDAETYYGCLNVSGLPSRCFTYNMQLWAYAPFLGVTDSRYIFLSAMHQVSGEGGSPYTTPYFLSYAVSENQGDTFWDVAMQHGQDRMEGQRGATVLPATMSSEMWVTSDPCLAVRTGPDPACYTPLAQAAVTFTASSVVAPEPATLALTGTGLLSVAGVTFRRKRRTHETTSSLTTTL